MQPTTTPPALLFQRSLLVIGGEVALGLVLPRRFRWGVGPLRTAGWPSNPIQKCRALGNPKELLPSLLLLLENKWLPQEEEEKLDCYCYDS